MALKFRKIVSLIIIGFCLIIPIALILTEDSESNQNITVQQTIDISIYTNDNSILKSTFTQGEVITFEVEDQSYSSVSIALGSSRRVFQLTLKKLASTWEQDWDTTDVPPDTYSIELTIDSSLEDCSPDSILLSASGGIGSTEWMMNVIILAAVMVVGVVGITVLYKRVF